MDNMKLKSRMSGKVQELQQPVEVVEAVGGGFRSVFKTRHGRVLFLALTVNGGDCTVTDCFYTDRN